MASLANFNKAFDRLISNEGGYVFNANDPGGETNWGISKNEYPDVNIKELTRDNAKNIYFNDFWTRLHLDNFPNSIAYQLFDFAVNSGIYTAIRAFQRALGVADDGRFGPVSQLAAFNMNETDIIMRLTAERLEFMTKLSNWPNASKGWINRMAKNLRFAAEDT